MLTKARSSAKKGIVTNVSFVKSRITSIALPDASVDVVISNCVINLVPDVEKHLVFKEMHRLLRPGGRVAVSDILVKKALPNEMKRNVALYVGCIAGASSEGEYAGWLSEAGFKDVVVVDAGNDLNVYTAGDKAGCCAEANEGREVERSYPYCSIGEIGDSDVSEVMKQELKGIDLNKWAGEYVAPISCSMLIRERIVQNIRYQKSVNLWRSRRHEMKTKTEECSDSRDQI
jgi:arsenite methyltransferase